ncbi:hypothetical protein PanWU01x14_160570 [Parasponia andersonii]|uniref:Transmembrane protein n=1 Tax=Parasponia andersonii TaxID=3476 RepID=A0A2P5CE49_PARAD|nr:hypothetical protein PanWU01x14_160570 [Parasponia andersonii]
MEGKMRLQAFSAAADLMRRNWTRGTILMVLYALWRLAVGLMLTLSDFFPRWELLFQGVRYKAVLEWLLSIGAGHEPRHFGGLLL